MFDTMKTILALSVVAMTATGALADREELNSGFHGNAPYQSLQNLATSAATSYAQAPVVRSERSRIGTRAAKARAQESSPRNSSASKANEVYEWGRYQGQDPDLNVRLMLRRDYHN